MTNPQQWDNLVGTTAVDSEGAKIGKIGQVYVNDATGEPAWVTVSTGFFGTRESLAPLDGAKVDDGGLQLAVTKHLVKDAPNIDADGHLAGENVDALYQHYADFFSRTATPSGARGSVSDTSGLGLDGTGYAEQNDAGFADQDKTGYAEQNDTGYADPDEAGTGYASPGPADLATATPGEEYDTSGRTADGTLIRSEERLHVGTESVPTGRVRLRKYVVTEMVTQTVPVSHEEIRVEREPITDANRDAALTDPDISEDEHVVTLSAERPVVEKETVPVERVRLGTETVTEEQEVSEQVRKEQIDDPDVHTGLRDNR